MERHENREQAAEIPQPQSSDLAGCDASMPQHPEPAAPLAKVDVTPGMLLHAAIEKGLTGDELEKLIELHERVEDRQARKEFAGALAKFQKACPPISKTSKANITTKSGSKYGYTYAELDEIARTVGPILHDLGLSYSWDSTVTDAMMQTTCTLRHENGHSITASFACPTASDAGMSPAQKHAAALTYARRQSLVQVLGLTTCDEDNDAAAAPAPVETITETQTRQLEDLLSRLDEEETANLKQWAGIDRLADMPAHRYKSATKGLENRVAEKLGGGL